MSWRDKVHPVTKKAHEAALDVGVQIDEEALETALDQRDGRANNPKNPR